MTRKLVAENWRLEGARYKIIGTHCKGCNGYHFPMKKLCLKCKSDENLSEYIFKGVGKIIEWTKIHEPAIGFQDISPYYYAIIEMEEGIRMSTQLTTVYTDEDKIKVGTKIEMVFRKLFQHGDEGIITYGFKAEPIFD